MAFSENILPKDKFNEKQKQIKSVFVEPEDDENNIEQGDA